MDIYMGPEGKVTVNDEDVNLPYNKAWRTKESVSIIRAGSSVSGNSCFTLSKIKQVDYLEVRYRGMMIRLVVNKLMTEMKGIEV